MKIIISPTKTMKANNHHEGSMPDFIEYTNYIIANLKSLNDKELEKYFTNNEKIFNENKIRLDNNFERKHEAIYTYTGIQYKYLDINTLDNKAVDYIYKNTRIISGLYGILKPNDIIGLYRLEMNAISDYWINKIKDYFITEDIVLNLCSNEYSKLFNKSNFINIIFYEKKNDKLIIKATEAKILRGLFLRFAATNNIYNIEDFKNFSELNYIYDNSLSNKNNLIFIKHV